MAKKKLGKGLGEIFGDDIDVVLSEISNGSSNKGSAIEININEVRPNPYQPRKQFDKQEIQGLADSIKEYGVINPISVRKSLSGYELIAGERRLRAGKVAGLKTIPAIIRDYNDQQMMAVSVLENVQREDLSPIEEANAYKQLIEKYDFTQEEIARQFGKSRTDVANKMRLLNLPTEIQKMVNSGDLSNGHARALLSLNDKKQMIEIANEAKSKGLSVRQVEALCKKTNKPSKKSKDKPRDPFMDDVVDRLQKKYSTKVEINNKSINIKYNDIEDLNRILEIMGLIEEG